MAESQRSRGRAGRDKWYTIYRQRVKQANFWVKKDGVFERPAPSWSYEELDVIRSRQAEPCNVENVNVTSNGIEIIQYAARYDRSDSQKGPQVRAEDEFAWSVVFKPKSMQEIRVREFQIMANDKHKRPSTFIEMCFKYEGLPESKNSTQLKTEQPEEGECIEEEGEIVEGALTDGGEAENEKTQEVAMEDNEDIGNEVEEVGDEMEENGKNVEDDGELRPDQFDLAKLFAGPNDFKNLEVRIAFLRSSAKQGRWQWKWPAVFAFLRGSEGWTPHTKIPQTQHQFSLPLNDWVLQFGNKTNQNFVARPQEDGTTEWTMQSAGGEQQQRQQRPSHSSVAVSAFGIPLSKALQLPPKPPASQQPASSPIPSQAEPSQVPRQRTLAEMEDQDDELEREEERLGQEQDRVRRQQEFLRREEDRLRQEAERVKALRKKLKEERKPGVPELMFSLQILSVARS